MKSFTKTTFLLLMVSLVLSLHAVLCAEEPISNQEAASGARFVTTTEDPSQPNLLLTPGGKTIHRTANPVSSLRTVFVPESAIQLYLWEEVLQNDQVQAFYAISRDGTNLSGRVRATTYSIRLRDHIFDPLMEVQPVHYALEARPSNSLYFVQFVTTPLPEFRSAIASLGGKVHCFLTDHTFIVEMSNHVSTQVAGLPYVRWVGPYHPEYRVEEYLRNALSGITQPLEEQRYSIMVCEHNHDRQLRLARLMQNLGGTVHFTTPKGIRMEATLTHDQLLSVVHASEVQFIDRWGGPGETDMNNVRSVGGADYLEGLTGWTGQGVRGEIFDTEIRITHQEWLYPPIIHSTGYTSFSKHGTSCYSINFAQGIDPNARGLVPDGQGIFFRYNESTQFGGTKSRYDINKELIDPSGPYRAVFQTASVGSDRTTQYTTISAETDDYLFLYPILSTQSQSNAGDQMSRPQAWAKNMVAVGACYHYDTADRSDDHWGHGASIGPASDGRIKPDLAFFYDKVLAASGTSCATPTTSGHFGLLFQMWHQQAWGGHGGGATVFDSKPQMATAKAMIINQAHRYDWSLGGPNADINRNVQGWGTADVKNLYDMAPQTMIIDETDVILPLETKTYNINVASGVPELKVTMVYTDPKGTVGANHHRINDLTLKVTSPSNTIYWGNNGLHNSNYSTPGGNSNTIDTVENVFILAPESGAWTVQVIADEVVQDSHPETPGLDADFALVISGISFPLEADTHTLPELGGTVNFTLDSGPGNANRTYLLLGTSSGNSPGIPLPGGTTTMPLNWDQLTNLIINQINSPVFSDFWGTLDGLGTATAQMNLGPIPGAAGYTMQFAYALSQPWDYVSNPLAVNIGP
ncbi:MAG: S8/S53 family peptidase [Planctomycetota bacterium]